MRRMLALAVATWAAAAMAAGAMPSVAQEAPPHGRPRAGRRAEAVRERMRALFAARLKADVGLDDAQIRAVLPKIETLERERGRIQRERLGVARELRRGLATGMADAELQRRLDALDGFGRQIERATSAALSKIDADLTVPQRVRLRFLMVRFRAEMLRRIRDLRGARAGADPPGPVE